MNRLLQASLAAAAALVLGAGGALAGGDAPDGDGGLLISDITDAKVQAVIDHDTAYAAGDGPNAGVNATGIVQFGDLGKFLLTTSVSWDWGHGDGVYEPIHRCALVNTSALSGVDAYVDTDNDGIPDTYVADSTTWAATMSLENIWSPKDEGDVLNGIIRGGSVCEIAYVYTDQSPCDTEVRIGDPDFPNSPVGTLAGTINEYMTAFSITDGVEDQGKGHDYDTASGDGFIHLIQNSCSGEVQVDRIFVNLDIDEFEKPHGRHHKKFYWGKRR